MDLMTLNTELYFDTRSDSSDGLSGDLFKDVLDEITKNPNKDDEQIAREQKIAELKGEVRKSMFGTMLVSTSVSGIGGVVYLKSKKIRGTKDEKEKAMILHGAAWSATGLFTGFLLSLFLNRSKLVEIRDLKGKF